jgi:hypothetical protein
LTRERGKQFSSLARFEVSPHSLRAAAKHQVDGLYASELERSPDLAGRQLWSKALHHGTATYDRVAESFLNSEELFARFRDQMN